MTVAFLFALAAAQQGGMISNSTSPPPAIIALPTAPPVPQMPPGPPTISRDGSGEAIVAVPIHVRVAVGSQILFEDTLRTARNAAASFEQTRSEAPAGACATNRGYSYGGNRESLRVQLYVLEPAQGGPNARVTVNWQRPSSSGDCSSEGSRTVAVSETVPLQPGQSATVRGDGGLVVTLTRR